MWEIAWEIVDGLARGTFKRAKEALGVGKSPYSMKQQIFRSLAVVLLIVVCLFAGRAWGFYEGYFEGTGTSPYAQVVEIGPPTYSDVSAQEVMDFVETNEVNQVYEYKAGFNCVEYAFMLARNAEWEGISALPIRLVFEDGTQHLLLAFPTEDMGWLFIEPGNDSVVKPRIGGELVGKRIVGMDFLRLEWIPFEGVSE